MSSTSSAESSGTQVEQFFTPEASVDIAERVLDNAICELKVAVCECLISRPMSDSIPVVPVDVCGDRFLIPYSPDSEAYDRVSSAVKRLGPIERSEVPPETVDKFRQLFAALFAWGHLHPEGDWSDQVERFSLGESCEQWEEGYVVGVFRNFLCGDAGQGGIAFMAGGDLRLCFDTQHQGMLERVLIDHCESSNGTLASIDRMNAAGLLLQEYPSLSQIHQKPQQVLEAVIGFVCTDG